MYLVQILLPLYDNQRRPVPHALHAEVQAELSEQFGGLTAYTRAPAEGYWKNPRARTHRDDVVVYEVMAERLDVRWWKRYRGNLEKRFRQEQVVVRSQRIRIL